MTINAAPDASEDFGPAMLALSDRQRIFVLEFLRNGGKNAKGAATKAGYAKGSQGGLEVQAHRLTRDKNVLAAIREESLKRMHSFGPEMFEVILEIARDRDAPAGERRKSAEAILDRIGLQAKTEHVVTVNDGRSRADLMKELIDGLRDLGPEAGVLVGGSAPKMIDITPEKAPADE